MAPRTDRAAATRRSTSTTGADLGSCQAVPRRLSANDAQEPPGYEGPRERTVIDVRADYLSTPGMYLNPGEGVTGDPRRDLVIEARVHRDRLVRHEGRRHRERWARLASEGERVDRCLAQEGGQGVRVARVSPRRGMGERARHRSGGYHAGRRSDSARCAGPVPSGCLRPLARDRSCPAWLAVRLLGVIPRSCEMTEQWHDRC